MKQTESSSKPHREAHVRKLRQASHRHVPVGLSGKKIFWVTVLNLTITIAELVGGLISGSLALLSDSLHNLGDSIAVVMSFLANQVAKRPKNARQTFGYKRAEILVAFINSAALLAISVFLITEAIRRWQNPETINGTLMIIIAAVGLAANLLSVFILEKESQINLNIKSSYLHLLSDAISSVGVIAGGIAIKLWGLVWIDPLITILISLYILRETWHMLRKTINILMQASARLDYPRIKQDIESLEHVCNIHHIHSWMMNDSTIHFEAHLDLDDMPLSEVEPIYDQIEQILLQHGISHITLQPEVDKCQNKNMF